MSATSRTAARTCWHAAHVAGATSCRDTQSQPLSRIRVRKHVAARLGPLRTQRRITREETLEGARRVERAGDTDRCESQLVAISPAQREHGFGKRVGRRARYTDRGLAVDQIEQAGAG